jgi:anti-anti-sigma regulatory factor
VSQQATTFAARSSGEGDFVRIVLAGELDLVAVAVLEHEVHRVAHVGIAGTLIDVSELTFCDLAGGRALLALVAAGACLTGSTPRCLRRLFELTGHEHVLPGPAPLSRVGGGM